MQIEQQIEVIENQIKTLEQEYNQLYSPQLRIELKNKITELNEQLIILNKKKDSYKRLETGLNKLIEIGNKDIKDLFGEKSSMSPNNNSLTNNNDNYIVKGLNKSKDIGNMEIRDIVEDKSSIYQKNDFLDNSVNDLESKLKNIESDSYLNENEQSNNCDIDSKQKEIDDIKKKLKNIELRRKTASGKALLKLTENEEKLLKKLKELDSNLFSNPNDNTAHDFFSNSDKESKPKEPTYKFSNVNNRTDYFSNSDKKSFFNSNNTNNTSFFDNKPSKEENMIVQVSSKNKEKQKDYFDNSKTNREILPVSKSKNQKSPESKTKEIIDNCKKVISCLRNKGHDSIIVDEIDAQIKKYEDLLNQSKEDDYFWKVAVVGSFSCGKSSFINSIIGEDIEPVDITPVNHANSIFTYGEKIKIKSGNKTFTKDEYLKEVKNVNTKYKEFIIEYPFEALKNIKLYDTPGFGSVNKGDSSKTNSDIELSKMAANSSDTIFYLVDLTNGTIDDPSLKYLKDINENKNLYIILTHADKKGPKARETVKEAITKQVENIGLDKEKVFLYSSIKEKYEKDPTFAFNWGCIITLLKGFYKKKSNKKSSELTKSNIKDIYNRLNKIVDKYEKEDINDFWNRRKDELLENYLNNIDLLLEEFMNRNSQFIVNNINQILYYNINEGYIKNTYSIYIRNDFYTFDKLSELQTYYYDLKIDANFIALYVLNSFCVPIFINLNKLKVFDFETWTEDGAKEEIIKIASVINKYFIEKWQEIKKAFVKWYIHEYDWKGKINEQVEEEFIKRWEEIDDCRKEIASLLNT